MKKLAFLGGAAGLGLVASLAAQRSQAADHLDSPPLLAAPTADINDLYAWMDGTNVNLAMSVSPADSPARTFGPAVQYVFHIHSKAQLGVGVAGLGRETRVICTFASNTSARCWVVEGTVIKDYIAGDPSGTQGISSRSGKVRLFAGPRADPSTFNLQGFRKATADLKARFAAPPAVQLDEAGCPKNLTAQEAGGYFSSLGAEVPGQPPCSPAGRDCFAEQNVRILLIQLDRSLVNFGQNTAIGVWASTHAAP